MAGKAEALIADLNEYEPSGDESADVQRLAGLAARWGKLPKADRARTVPAMLGIFERNPDSAELGMPGPVVHALEADGGGGGGGYYEAALLASLERKPSYYCLWMLNRILNGRLGAKRRGRLLGALARVAGDRKATRIVRREAKSFLKFQETGE